MDIKALFPLSFQIHPELELPTREFLKRTELLEARWFPVFLKAEQHPPVVFQLAQYEYLLKSVADSPILEKIKVDPEAIELNSSFATTHLSCSYESLHLQKGLYAFFKTQNSTVCILRLNREQALMIDLLREDFQWTKSSFLHTLNETKPSSIKNFWATEINRLEQLGLIL